MNPRDSFLRVLEQWDGTNWDRVDNIPQAAEQDPPQELARDLIARIQLERPQCYIPIDDDDDDDDEDASEADLTGKETPESSVLTTSRSSDSSVAPGSTRPKDEFNKALAVVNGEPDLNVKCSLMRCREGCPQCNWGAFTSEDQKRPHWRYRCRLTPEEAETNCAVFMESVHLGRSQITQMLAKHADEIMKRWNSGGQFGSEAKREALLKQAAPSLCESLFFMSNGPYGAKKPPDPSNRSKPMRSRLMFPWLNVKLLKTHPDALFALLHRRSHDSLQDWHTFDESQIRTPFYAGAFDVYWSDRVIIVHGKDYGKVTEWNADRIHRREVTPYPLGHLLLEAQVSMRQRAEDHLWSLQHDITYFRRQLQLITDSIHWDEVSEKMKGERFVSQMVMMLLDCCNLYCLEQEAQKFHDICRQYSKNNIAPGSFLPHDYDLALSTFSRHLFSQKLHRESRLKLDLCQAPGFSEWSVGPEDGCCQDCRPCEEHTLVGPCRPCPPGGATLENFGNNFFDWCLTHITIPSPDFYTNFDARLFHSLLNDHLEQCPEEDKLRLDEDILQNVSDLGSISHFWTTIISLHFPNRTVNPKEAVIEKSFAWRWMLLDRERWPMKERTYQAIKSSFGTIGEAPITAFQNYGSHETEPDATQTNHDEEERLRCIVAEFWTFVIEEVEESINELDLTQVEKRELLSLISLGRSPDHPYFIQAEENTTSIRIEKKGTKKPKDKRKKRLGQVSDKSNTGSLPKETSGEKKDVERILSIPVSRQTYDEVLCAMFPVTENENSQSVHWKAFVAAMEAVGFQARPIATEHDVLFEHEEYGAFVFYKPHPGPFIDPVLCQHYGKRMEKRCQWRRDAFVVENS
ncbi:hypothetical protein N0V93_009504 [Gnomoniopsis smithogilvyi]|uniref:Uncharacterized protein n=1 Tax=Gnomoniopsis smithogilvyi TaxID=1191159 RepID=A0A9W9CSV6_9PEZI|nr:hypothetical protein N0V93_009504 [Gnomoniopsis smithogilvyi]